jgi:hypothetical protein
MLIDKVNACTSSINELSTMRTNELSISAFENAVRKLNTVDSLVVDFVATVEEMNKTDFCKLSLSEDDIEKLRSAIITCAAAVNEMSLTTNNVTVLTNYIQSQKAVLTALWNLNAKPYVDPIRSYLGVIQSFAENKDEISGLIKALGTGSSGEPSPPVVRTLVANVKKANSITSGFQMSDGVRSFLQKAKNGKATYADITPDVSAWIEEHRLGNKIRIGF